MKDYNKILMQYCSDIKSGRIPAGRYTIKAIERFLSDLKRQNKDDFPYIYKQDAADVLCDFIETLKPGDLRGKSIELLNWQVFVLCNLEGWRYKNDEERKRFRTGYVEVARKNGKTTGIMEGITLYNFIKYKASESYLVSSSEDLAKKTFKEVIDIIKSDADLDELLDPKSLAITFKDKTEKSRLSFYCDGCKMPDGLKVRFYCIDEYHQYPTDEVVQSMHYGTRANKDAQGVIITTADTEVSVPCYEQHLKSKKILNKTANQDDFFCIIYSLDETDDFKNPENWIKANPSLNVTIDESVIKSDLDDALLTPYKLAEFKAKTFNIWGGGSEHSWMPIETWQKNKDIIPDWAQFEGKTAVVGMDLATTSDLCGYVIMFKVDGKEFYNHKWYIPEATLMERYKSENVNFLAWAENEVINVIPGQTNDLHRIASDFLDDADRFKIKALGYDKWQSNEVIREIEEKRPDILLIEIEQSLKKLSPIFKDYEKAIKDGKVVDNSPLSLWAVNNVQIRPDENDNYKPMKKSKASNCRIDPIVAATMAHGVAKMPEVEDYLDSKPLSFSALKALL